MHLRISGYLPFWVSVCLFVCPEQFWPRPSRQRIQAGKNIIHTLSSKNANFCFLKKSFLAFLEPFWMIFLGKKCKLLFYKARYRPTEIFFDIVLKKNLLQTSSSKKYLFFIFEKVIFGFFYYGACRWFFRLSLKIHLGHGFWYQTACPQPRHHK